MNAPPGPSKPSCITCGDWGCVRCRDPYETAVRAGGEQGPSVEDLLRADIARLEAEIQRLKAHIARVKEAVERHDL